MGLENHVLIVKFTAANGCMLGCVAPPPVEPDANVCVCVPTGSILRVPGVVNTFISPKLESTSITGMVHDAEI